MTPPPWFRFNLRTLLVLFVGLGFILAYVAYTGRVQQEILRRTTRLGGYVTWSYQYGANGGWIGKTDVFGVPADEEQNTLLPPAFAFRIHGVVVPNETPMDDVSRLQALADQVPYYIDVANHSEAGG